MRRRTVAAVVVAVGLVAAQRAVGEDGTGVVGTVESSVELTLSMPAAGRVDATATATVGLTQLSVSTPGHRARVVRAFPSPIAGERVTVRGDAQQTITFGPQGP